jgi:hypothetical protein
MCNSVDKLCRQPANFCGGVFRMTVVLKTFIFLFVTFPPYYASPFPLLHLQANVFKQFKVSFISSSYLQMCYKREKGKGRRARYFPGL